jgi:peptidoglycan hydrolase CwlO-like protein
MEDKKERLILTVCIVIMLIILIAFSKAEIIERYNLAQKEKQYLLKENLKYENKIKDQDAKIKELEELQDSNANNIDTRK